MRTGSFWPGRLTALCPPACLCLFALTGLCSAEVPPGAAAPAQTSASSPAAAHTTIPPAPKPPDAYERALALYRAGKFAEAGAVLEAAIQWGGGRRAYEALLGWCYVRQQRYAEAAAAFRAELKFEPGSREARQGLALSLAASGDAKGSLDLALPLVAERPDDAEAVAVVNRALAATKTTPDRRLRDPKPLVPAIAQGRAGRDYLEVPWKGGLVPLFIKGVNMGVALPGKFPSEFPEDVATYREWLDQIGAMGANAVRLYTLLPPAFYQALKDHDDAIAAADPDSKTPPRGYLWLFQGVWTELPDNDRYDDPAFASSFRDEAERILDALHGDIAVGRRPGHAFGLYLADVSAMTAGIILGREWEPFSVQAYDRAHPGAAFRGRYFSAQNGTARGGTPQAVTAMEAWVAAMMDHAVSYETGRYGTMRPIAFTNWPTLDPLHHETEATKAEEASLAKKLGIPLDSRAVREYDNDGPGIDATRILASSEAAAGQFASYHAYPYYPDFMNVDPNYLTARDAAGPDNYVGYLTELKGHHRTMPVLISEIGVPTSRGIAHVQPQGFNHGGHNEKEQGEIDARLVQNIHDTRCAGGILFAWLDEWFKRNWLVMEFEKPAERNVKWLNALDPEQNYGLLAARPGKDGPRIILDGKGDDWKGLAPIATHTDGDADGALKALWASHDEAYFYLRLDTGGGGAGAAGRVDFRARQYLIGIDTYGKEEGDRQFPYNLPLREPTGMEFMVEISGEKTSRLLVDTPYDLFTHTQNRPYRSVPNDDGQYIEIKVETNRSRIGRDGTVYPAVMNDLSPLRLGTTDSNATGYDDLADWSYDARSGVVEIRIPWGLLNVTDPSSRRVVEDDPDNLDEVGTRVTDGFRLYAAARDPRDGSLLDTLSAPYTWAGWEQPSFHTKLKRSYAIVRERFLALPDVVAP